MCINSNHWGGKTILILVFWYPDFHQDYSMLFLWTISQKVYSTCLHLSQCVSGLFGYAISLNEKYLFVQLRAMPCMYHESRTGLLRPFLFSLQSFVWSKQHFNHGHSVGPACGRPPASKVSIHTFEVVKGNVSSTWLFPTTSRPAAIVRPHCGELCTRFCPVSFGKLLAYE